MTKEIVWLKMRLSREKQRHAIRIASGIARSYRKDRNFSVLDFKTGKIVTFKAKNSEKQITDYSTETLNLGMHNYRDFLKEVIVWGEENSSMLYVVNATKADIENLTKKSDWIILCVYVTMCRSTFDNITSECNATKAVQNMRHMAKFLVKMSEDKESSRGVVDAKVDIKDEMFIK